METGLCHHARYRFAKKIEAKLATKRLAPCCGVNISFIDGQETIIYITPEWCS